MNLTWHPGVTKKCPCCNAIFSFWTRSPSENLLSNLQLAFGKTNKSQERTKLSCWIVQSNCFELYYCERSFTNKIMKVTSIALLSLCGYAAAGRPQLSVSFSWVGLGSFGCAMPCVSVYFVWEAQCWFWEAISQINSGRSHPWVNKIHSQPPR